ncbi:hypothetical protein TKK_0018273 [Trichogramma kaykai]|uniref:GRIP domain-containing protein n=1 Tax=Trichogramma kaykai TaxID=54128 RepID=A0ABD2VZN9_9HYME
MMEENTTGISDVASNCNGNNDEKINSDDSYVNIGERYNKLRGLAVKLKKKVSDLTEQVKNLETDNQKLGNEKEEMQNKILLMSDSVKKLQTIQSQYDRSQDDVELIKNENKRLTKRLETLVLENDSFRDTIMKEKRDLSEATAKINNLLEEKIKLESNCDQLEKKIKELNYELKAEVVLRQQKAKEYEDMKTALDAELKAHKATLAKMDNMKFDRKSNNVLSLEVANYEKSIETIKHKLDEETNERISLEGTIKQHLETIEVLTARIMELQDSCLSKATRITILEEKNSTFEMETREAKSEAAKAVNEKDAANRELTRLMLAKKDLEAKIESLTLEMGRVEEENSARIKALESLIEELKREVSRLNLALESSKMEITTLQADFDSYKLRAQSVLLRTKTAPSSELEEEIEQGRHQIQMLNEKCECYSERIESLMREILLLKHERSRAVASEAELQDKLSVFRQDSVMLLEKMKNKEIEVQRIQINHEKIVDTLRRNYEEELSNLKKKHEEEIKNVKIEANIASQMSSQMNLNTEAIKPSVGSSSVPPLIEREECEGSESIDSLHLTLKNVEQRGPNPRTKSSRSESPMITQITPLDQLLEFPFDEHNVVLASRVPEDSPEVIAYKNRVKHLTELLADAERDIDKLTQQNQLLKEDIRLQKRYVEREKEAVNFEYLKNVVFKFCTLENRDERSRLVPVLDTILKLSPEETHKLNEIVSTTGGVIQKRIWIPGWSTS